MQIKGLSAKHMAKDFMSKISVNTPTKGIKDADSVTMSSLVKTISEVNKKFQPISWTRKVMPSSRLFKGKKMPVSLLVKYLDRRSLKYSFIDDFETKSIASTKTYDERRREWDTIASQAQVS